jgi:hypothetical protein
VLEGWSLDLHKPDTGSVYALSWKLDGTGFFLSLFWVSASRTFRIAHKIVFGGADDD